MTSCHSVGKAEHAEPVGQERQDQHAERHAEQAADAAGEADAAEHHRGDHLELEAEAGDVHCAEPRRDDSMMPEMPASSEQMMKPMNLMRRTS